MALLYSRRRCFSSVLVDSSGVCSFASFEVDGVVEFLHRERLQCVVVLLVRVFVFVFVCLRH